VKAVEARDLLPMDMNGSSDPYVVARVGSQEGKTNYITTDLNPVWNEVLNFDIESGQEILQVEVWDHDDIGKDDFEGHFQRDLSQFWD